MSEAEKEFAKLKPEERLGSKPVETEYHRSLRAVFMTIDEWLNPDKADKKVGIIVMMFPLGERPGRCNYMSNAKREDIVVLLKEQLRYFEGQPENLSGRG